MHEIGLDEKACFAAAGAADDQHVFIPCRPRIFGAIVHGQALGLCEDDVILEYRVDIRRDVLMRAPAGAAVLHILAKLLGILAFDVDRQPERGGDQEADQQIGGVEARKQALKGQPEAIQNMQCLLREIHSRCQPRRLPAFGSQQGEQKIREIGDNDFLDVYRLFHSSSPLSLCLTAGLMMSFAA